MDKVIAIIELRKDKLSNYLCLPVWYARNTFNRKKKRKMKRKRKKKKNLFDMT